MRSIVSKDWLQNARASPAKAPERRRTLQPSQRHCIRSSGASFFLTSGQSGAPLHHYQMCWRGLLKRPQSALPFASQPHQLPLRQRFRPTPPSASQMSAALRDLGELRKDGCPVIQPVGPWLGAQVGQGDPTEPSREPLIQRVADIFAKIKAKTARAADQDVHLGRSSDVM